MVFIAATVTVFFINYELLVPKFKPGDEKYFHIYGNTGSLKQNISIPMNSLYDGSFMIKEYINATFLNAFGRQYEEDIRGVVINEIFTRYDLMYENVTHIQFIAIDGYKSPKLPISVMKENPEEVLILTHIDGVQIKPKIKGGDGPLVGYCSLAVLQSNEEIIQWCAENNDYGGTHVYNTMFKVKYFVAIEVF